MYAIPWYLTLFAHTLTLEKVFVLWDTLLLGSPTLAHFITLAILKEIRSTLLPLDQNACVSLRWPFFYLCVHALGPVCLWWVYVQYKLLRAFYRAC